jgi:hypothetical protein
VYRSPIGNFVIGQTQLGNQISRTDKTFRWGDPSIAEIRGGQLPGFIANRATC